MFVFLLLFCLFLHCQLVISCVCPGTCLSWYILWITKQVTIFIRIGFMVRNWEPFLEMKCMNLVKVIAILTDFLPCRLPSLVLDKWSINIDFNRNITVKTKLVFRVKTIVLLIINFQIYSHGSNNKEGIFYINIWLS